MVIESRAQWSPRLEVPHLDDDIADDGVKPRAVGGMTCRGKVQPPRSRTLNLLATADWASHATFLPHLLRHPDETLLGLSNRPTPTVRDNLF